MRVHGSPMCSLLLFIYDFVLDQNSYNKSLYFSKNIKYNLICYSLYTSVCELRVISPKINHWYGSNIKSRT